MHIGIGDWIAFLQVGKVVIGLVLYIIPANREIVTTAGICLADAVLERRGKESA